MSYSVQDTLDVIDELELTDQEIVFDLFSKRIVERRREQIRLNADETLKAVKDGKAKKGNLQSLLLDLE